MAVKKDDIKDIAKTYVAVRGAMHHSDKQRKKDNDALKEELRKQKEAHKEEMAKFRKEQQILHKKSEITTLLSTSTGKKELKQQYLKRINRIKNNTIPLANQDSTLADQTIHEGDTVLFEFTSKHLSEYLKKYPETIDAIKIRDEFYSPEKNISDNSILEEVYKPYRKLISSFKTEKHSKKVEEEFSEEANNYINSVLKGEETPNTYIFKLPQLKKIRKENIKLAKNKTDQKKILIKPLNITLAVLAIIFLVTGAGFISIILIIILVYKHWKKISALNDFKKKLLSNI